jgi:hypothetical protein
MPTETRGTQAGAGVTVIVLNNACAELTLGESTLMKHARAKMLKSDPLCTTLPPLVKLNENGISSMSFSPFPYRFAILQGVSSCEPNTVHSYLEISLETFRVQSAEATRSTTTSSAAKASKAPQELQVPYTFLMVFSFCAPVKTGEVVVNERVSIWAVVVVAGVHESGRISFLDIDIGR